MKNGDEVVGGVGKRTGNNIPEVKFTKEQPANKPKNAPNPERWLNKGGTIKIDEQDTWRYTDWEGNSVSYPDGYADFKSSGMVKQEVRKFQNYDKDFAKADKLAPNGPKSDKTHGIIMRI
ncbi:cytoplasmic protein [Halobacillus shinanisalinarum]|uniref:Cytoplasmic protein n=1 Tax=Halobacillus shinanisalinarum TaxID=2932258 RepID=A0ABY4GW11_9BACI|nr:cytoplasmic protein [Halobacillus shinanisalinarum]UOQ92229.1 cytoplasmic protein [Halobacillus shinanisalinarum]